MPEVSADGTTPKASKPSAAYHLFRYVPNLLRDEWVNIGVLVFHPQTGERRLRLIEDQDEYNRVRRLHTWADEALLRALRNDLEDRLDSASPANGDSAGGMFFLLQQALTERAAQFSLPAFASESSTESKCARYS